MKNGVIAAALAFALHAASAGADSTDGACLQPLDIKGIASVVRKNPTKLNQAFFQALSKDNLEALKEELSSNLRTKDPFKPVRNEMKAALRDFKNLMRKLERNADSRNPRDLSQEIARFGTEHPDYADILKSVLAKTLSQDDTVTQFQMREVSLEGIALKVKVEEEASLKKVQGFLNGINDQKPLCVLN